jgi:hypothetical protein
MIKGLFSGEQRLSPWRCKVENSEVAAARAAS